MEKITTILLLFSCSMVAAIRAAGVLTSCARNYEKVGCFINKSDQSKSMLVYDRYSIQWKNIEAYMHSLACRCETKAREEKYAGFAIHFWGECYGKTQAQLDAVGKKTESNECTGDQKYDGCSAKNKECAGHAYTDFVYRLKLVKSFEKTFCNDTEGFLECNKGEKVLVMAGSYGARTAANCGAPVTEGWQEKCSVFSSLDLEGYRGACISTSKCDITGWSVPFNDPCKGVSKFLKLQYTCRAA